MEFNVLYNIKDKVKYVNSEKVMVVVGYEVRGDFIKYICIIEWDRHTCCAVEIEPCGDCTPIGFSINKV